MKVKHLAASLMMSALLAQPMHASAVVANHTYIVSYNGTSYSHSYTGDLNMEVGETLQLSFLADSNDYWENMLNAQFFSGIGVLANANRVGDYTWRYMLDGALVANGSSMGDGSAFAHVINFVPGYAGMFDELTIEYNLLSSTSGNNNPLQESPNAYWLNTPFNATYVNPTVAAEVSEPANIAILVLGLTAMGLARRRAQVIAR